MFWPQRHHLPKQGRNPSPLDQESLRLTSFDLAKAHRANKNALRTWMVLLRRSTSDSSSSMQKLLNSDEGKFFSAFFMYLTPIGWHTQTKLWWAISQNYVQGLRDHFNLSRSHIVFEDKWRLSRIEGGIKSELVKKKNRDIWSLVYVSWGSATSEGGLNTRKKRRSVPS